MSKKGLFCFLDLTFLVSFLLSLTVVVLRPDIYARPISYFILTSFAASLIAAEIFLFEKENKRTFLILGKILLVSASLRLVPQLLYPGLIGIDPWYHQAFFNQIMAQGKIPLGAGYSWLPVFHLIAVSFSSLTGLDYKISVMTSTGFFNIVSLVFVFLMGKRFSSVRLGLLAALTLGIADWYIDAGFWIIPNTLAAALIVVLVYLVFRQDDIWSSKFALLCGLSSAVLIMTHALASLAMSMILACFVLSQFILRKKSEYSRGIVKFQVAFFAIFTAAMLAYWNFVSGHIQNLINGIQHALRFEHLIASPATVAFRNAHFLEFLTGTIGIFMFYGISFVALLFSLRKLSKRFFALAFAGVVTTLPAFLGYALSFTALYPQRWFLYSEPFMAFFAAFGLLSLRDLGKSRKARSAMVVLVLSTVIVLSFFATTSPISDIDTPVYTPDLTVRFFFYTSEMEAGVFLQNQNTGKLYTDTLYTVLLKGALDFSSEIITDNLTSIETIALRQMVAEAPFYVKGYLGTYRLNYDIKSQLDFNFCRVYDSETVLLYTRSR